MRSFAARHGTYGSGKRTSLSNTDYLQDIGRRSRSPVMGSDYGKVICATDIGPITSDNFR